MDEEEREYIKKGNGEPQGGDGDGVSGDWEVESPPFSQDETAAMQGLLAGLQEAVQRGEVSEEAAAGARGRRRGRQLLRPEQRKRVQLTSAQRMLVLDLWVRSGLTAGEFAPLVGVSKHTLYVWKRDFRRHGPAALEDKPRGRRRKSGKVAEATKRAILLMKEMNADLGCLRISQELARSQGLGASEAQVRRVLLEAGYELQEIHLEPRRERVQRFERARPNQLWMTDLFSFALSRRGRKVHLVAYLDDHSRYLVGFGVHASATTAVVLDVLLTAVAAYGPPEEVLTDNGPQYASWRGRSRYNRELHKLGIRQILARPRHPQTLGKIERFWQTLDRECLSRAVMGDLEEARRRIGFFVDYYNFRRPHQGIGGLCPADRYFGVASEVKEMLAQRVAENALELARHGEPKQPFYLTGAVGGKTFSVHAAGERVVLSRSDGKPEAVELVGPPEREPAGEVPPTPLSIATPLGVFDKLVDEAEEAGPGKSPLDEALAAVRASLAEQLAEQQAEAEADESGTEASAESSRNQDEDDREEEGGDDE